MEQEIKIAAKLYECRDTAKTLAKLKEKDYLEMVFPYMKLIEVVMKEHGINELKALLKIAETEVYQESVVSQLLFMAAAVEIMEPSSGEG